MTLTWVPQGAGDPVPSVVVLLKEATASWSGGSGGSCANGLGHPPVGSSGGQVSTGVAYEVLQSPTSPIVTTIAPTANVTSPQGTDVGAAAAFVKVSAIVPTLSFAGSKESTIGSTKHQNILVGQLLRATVDLGGLPFGNSDEFAWTVSEGSPFNNYSASDTTGTFTPFAPPNARAADWFYGKGVPGDPLQEEAGVVSSVSCAVKLCDPEPEIEFTLTRDVRVFEPDKPTNLEFPVNPRFVIGTVQLLSNTSSPHSLRLWGVECPPDGYTGMTWESAMTPIPFFTNGGDGWFGWFQLGTAKLEWQDGSVLRKNQNYGLEGLDFGAPYGHLTFPVDGTASCTGDAPGYVGGPMTDPDTVWASIDFTFKLNLMYKPPTNGLATTGVPLHRPAPWYCKGKATKGTPWMLSGSGQGITPNPNPARVFFQWSRSLQNGLDTWVPPP